MNKQELLNEVESKTGYELDVIDEILDSLTTVIGNSLIDGNDVEIEDFGIFQNKTWKGRNIKNVNSGKITKTQDSRVIRFQPTKELRDAIK